MSLKYVILDAGEVGDIVFSEVFETSAATLRYNLAGTQTFVKYEGAKPRFSLRQRTLIPIPKFWQSSPPAHGAHVRPMRISLLAMLTMLTGCSNEIA